MGGEPTYDPLVSAVRRQAGRAGRSGRAGEAGDAGGDGGGVPGTLRPPSSGRALVLIPQEGPLLTVWPGQPLPAVPAGGYQAVLTLDVDEHALVLPVQLPCAEPGVVFHRRVELLCRVADPALVVGHGIRDVGSVVYGPVRDALSAVARRYGPGQAAEADAAMEAALRDVAGDAAVRVRCARLGADRGEARASGPGGPLGAGAGAGAGTGPGPISGAAGAGLAGSPEVLGVPGAGAAGSPEVLGGPRAGAGRVLRGEVTGRRDAGARGEGRKVSRVRGSGVGGGPGAAGAGAVSGAGAGAAGAAASGAGAVPAPPAEGVRRSRVRGARREGGKGEGAS